MCQFYGSTYVYTMKFLTITATRNVGIKNLIINL